MDDCSATSTSDIYLPTSFIVDMNITVPNNGEVEIEQRFFVSRVTQYGSMIKVVISYQPVNGKAFDCLISEDIPTDITASFAVTDRMFSLFPSPMIPADYEDMNKIKAYLVIGTCVDIISTNDLTFTYEASMLSPMAVNIVIYDTSDEYIDSVTIKDGAGNTIKKLTEDFIISAGEGINIRVDESGVLPAVIIERDNSVDDNDTDTPLSVDDVVNMVLAEIGTPITSINGVTPASNGNITISGKSCTEVTTGTAAIYISNPCAVPCCPESTTSVAPALTMLQDASTRLLQYFESMNVTINSMQSRLAALIAYRK